MVNPVYPLKIILTTLLVATVAAAAMSQTRSVSVSDDRSGTPISYANVTNLRTGTSQTTDDVGNCHITARDGDKLTVTHVAYGDTVIIAIADIIRYEISLQPRELRAVDIYAGPSFNQRASQGIHEIPMPFLTSAPTFLGEPDILKALTFLPGVSEGREGYSHLFVRGGDQDQNLILFDGATMLNVNHFGGYISMFHPEMVGAVNFYKSHWPSKFGGRLSSVVDIRTAEGNYKEHRQSIQLGLVAPKISVSGPLWKDKISYHLGARRTIADLITGPIAKKIRSGKRDGDIGDLATQDITLRIDGRIKDNQHIALSALHGRDGYNFLERYPNYEHLSEERYGIKNEVLTLNYRFDSSPSTFFTAHASYSGYRHFYRDELTERQYNFGKEQYELQQYRHTGNRVQSMKLNAHGESRLSDRWNLKYGLEREWLNYQIYLNREESANGAIISAFDGRIEKNGVSTTSLSTDSRYRLNDRLDINAGIRMSRYDNDDYSKWLAEPKMLLTYRLDRSSTLNAAFNIQRQHTVLLGFTDDSGQFREFYMTSEDRTPPSSSRQWSMGYFKNVNGIVDNLSVELFYKNQSDIVKYIPSVDFDRDVLEYTDYLHGKGRARIYGVEALLQKTTGNLHGSLSYTYAQSRARFPTLNNGSPFNADFDFRHSVNALLLYSFGKGYRLSGHWTYKTGRPFTMPTSHSGFDGQPAFFPIMTGINNMRMPAFHRLDINFERRWTTKKGNKNWFGVGIYNVYNRVNPFFAQPADRPGKLEVVGMYPLTPFFNLGFEL